MKMFIIAVATLFFLSATPAKSENKPPHPEQIVKRYENIIKGVVQALDYCEKHHLTITKCRRFVYMKIRGSVMIRVLLDSSRVGGTDGANKEIEKFLGNPRVGKGETGLKITIDELKQMKSKSK